MPVGWVVPLGVVLQGRRRMFEPIRAASTEILGRSDSSKGGALWRPMASRNDWLGGAKFMFPPWHELGQLKNSLSRPPSSEPKYLIVLVHGLQGKAEDLDYMQKILLEASDDRGQEILVHCPNVNWRRTKDGVAAGAQRVAENVREFVALHPELEMISIVGFSLGGIYSRYAAALLFDKERGTVAGLQPRMFVGVAAPHLGVRGFGVYRFFHPNIQAPVAKAVAGLTGEEMVLSDSGQFSKGPLLLEMSEDQEGLPFLSALRSFQRKVLYGNVQNDFMVAFGTAVLDPSITGLRVDYQPPDHAEIIDEEKDALGCRVWFKSKADVSYAQSAQNEMTHEELMARRLRELGWETIGIQFDQVLPIAHNLIISKMRFELEWLLLMHRGQRCVHHMVEMLLDENWQTV